MVCVYALSTVRKDKIEEHTRLAKELVAETIKEPGNISYEFGKLEGEENKFAFVERWQSMEALEEHFEMPHFKKYVPLMNELREGESSVTKITVL